MYHIPYMILNHQLVDQSKAKLIIEGVEVYFIKDRCKSDWTIKASIPLFSEALSCMTTQVLEDLDSISLKKASAKIELYLEEGCALFSQDVSPISSYDGFKQTIESFMQLYDFWRSIVEDIVKSETLFAL